MTLKEFQHALDEAAAPIIEKIRTLVPCRRVTLVPGRLSFQTDPEGHFYDVDVSFGRKMTPEEVKEVERLVNMAIEADAPVVMEEMTVPEAKEKGAIGLFESKYGERVRTYKMGDFSFEICGGPHAAHTGELGSFKIQKEESSSAGVRRIKATITGPKA